MDGIGGYLYEIDTLGNLSRHASNPKHSLDKPDSEGMMFIPMRKTIYLNDELGARFEAAAQRAGVSLSAFLVEAGRRQIEIPTPSPPPFKLLTRGGRGLRKGIDLDRTGELLAAEDEAEFKISGDDHAPHRNSRNR